MRPDKFTAKMQEALQSAQDIASKFSHQEINNEHFLFALLGLSDGVVRPLLEKLGVSISALEGRLQDELANTKTATVSDQEKTKIQMASKVRSYSGLMVHVFGRIAAALGHARTDQIGRAA